MKTKSLHDTVLFYYVILVVSFFYAYILSNIPMEGVMDRENYISYTSNAEAIYERYNYIFIFFNEPIWLLLNKNLYSYFNDSEAVIRFYIFIASMTMSFVVLRQSKKHFIYLIGIIFLWQIMFNYIVHLRQGVAMAVFLLGYLSKNRNIKLFFYLLSPLIHVSFFIVLSILYFSYYLTKTKLPLYVNYIFQLAVYVLLSLSILTISIYFGSRQGEGYADVTAATSGTGFLYWLIIFLLFISEKKQFQKKNNVAISFILFYLSGYFLLPVVGRVFEDVLILILLAALNLSKKKLFIYLLLFSAYFIMQGNSLLNFIVNI